jgi:hypothetical protein
LDHFDARFRLFSRFRSFRRAERSALLSRKVFHLRTGVVLEGGLLL